MAEERNDKGIKTQGGMLSGADIRKRIIHKDDIDKYLELFEKRDFRCLAGAKVFSL